MSATAETLETQTCSECRESKPLDNFHRRGSRRYEVCKPCRSALRFAKIAADRELGDLHRVLPFAPLKVVLKARAWEMRTVRGHHGHADEDERFCPGGCLLARKLGDRIGLSEEAITKWWLRGEQHGVIPWDRADSLCTALGLHPSNVWPKQWSAMQW